GSFAVLKGAFFLSAMILVIHSTGLGARLFTEKIQDESILYKPLRKFATATLSLFNINLNHLVPDNETEVDCIALQVIFNIFAPDFVSNRTRIIFHEFC